MTFRSDEARQAADYGFARSRDLAFDAVGQLWRRRRDEGMTQTALAQAIGRDRGWVSKNLGAPGNWTLRVFGELVQGLRGEVEIRVTALEDGAQNIPNYDAYEGYGPDSQLPSVGIAPTNVTEVVPITVIVGAETRMSVSWAATTLPNAQAAME